MDRNYFHLSSLLLLITLFTVGCSVSTVDYVGTSYDPTTTVDVYTSIGEIEKAYSVIGHALGIGMPLGISSFKQPSTDKIEKKLIEEAKRKGADAILIVGTGVKKEKVGDDLGIELGEGTVIDLTPKMVTENQMKVSFLKYK